MTPQLQQYSSKIIRFTLASVAVFNLCACDQAQPMVYDIPKETREVAAPSNTEESTPSSTEGAPKMQLLPGMQEAAEAAPGISYTVPDGWEELPPSGIRKATFKVTNDNGSAEISVLTFPGDVGGTLANINRWREQIELKPATQKSSAEFSEIYRIANHEGLYVQLVGAKQSILGGLLPFHGDTWFFKMLGDSPVVLANEGAMKQFLSSITFNDHTH